MIDRRTLLQLAGLGGLAVMSAPLMTACSGSPSSPIQLAASNVAFGAGDPARIAPAVAGMTDLGSQLLARLGGTQGPPANLALSPYSIALALAMTVNGANGTTAKQMLDVLGVDAVASLNDGLAALIHAIDGLAGQRDNVYGKTGTVELATANSLFGQIDTHWQAAFLDALKASYDAGMRMVDYKSDPEACRTTINSWVSDQTHDRIPQLIPAGVIDTLTRLTLVNTLYFKAPWWQKFDKGRTAPGTFTLADGSTTTVDMMRNLFDSVSAADRGTWQTLQLPYAGQDLAMSVVLPGPGQYDSVWAMATSGQLDRLLAVEPDQGVDLTLPKWTFRTQSPLKGALEDMGMTIPFDPTKADFTGMTSDEQLFIQDALHEVFIAVDEDGTEAAAATAVVAGTTAAHQSFTMTVDRPFLFVIHDVSHSTPLFVGRVMDPAAS